ncbi:dethiobiotin synthase [Iodobacter fluviatilis]|uniref:ATP-dependent dethiobiotin synthetase BioD n=1 Tax=Iodobacter fluviatilis TaxID=537 RepID=A0A377Q5E4_9NEIS|nr:dethiobiotin synthase [Iodobacter fluviatilis]TCU84512.1 dethiobiotin synthetase [Iodobacter fluviatilis]STQ89978.1 ATP-dependent dethiobiotin synthetase BioD 1 [Iodobacter fluviatilis]
MSGQMYFVTGTDTDVGKTIATAQLLRAFVAGGQLAVGMKPVAAGCEWRNGQLWNSDVAAHAAASNIAAPAHLACPYLFEAPVSPHLAAKDAAQVLDLDLMVSAANALQALADVVLVEGAGGWFSPLSEDASMADLATRLQAPVILVVGMRLGCLNHAMLSAKAILAAGLPLAGWIANQPDSVMPRYAENVQYLQTHLPAPLLAEIAYSPQALDQALPAQSIAALACRAGAKHTINN